MPLDHSHNEDHDRGLAFDLDTIARARVERRRALAWMAGAGTTALLAGCGGGGGSSTASTATTTATTTSTSTSSAATGSTSNSTGGTTATACVADPSETAGPYPGDGTNSAAGATNNVLTASGIVRSDIRASFISSTTIAAGVQVTLTLTLVDVASGCAALAGYAIYLWQCDRNGLYSLYSIAAESYLRGVQVTDANGQVTFTTIFPGCYDGRWPHMHFEVFSSLSAATRGSNAKLTSQFAMPSDVAATVFADTATYPSSRSNFARVTLASDNVFGDNSAAQLAAQTPAFAGSAAAGYTATATIGINA